MDKVRMAKVGLAASTGCLALNEGMRLLLRSPGLSAIAERLPRVNLDVPIAAVCGTVIVISAAVLLELRRK